MGLAFRTPYAKSIEVSFINLTDDLRLITKMAKRALRMRKYTIVVRLNI